MLSGVVFLVHFVFMSALGGFMMVFPRTIESAIVYAVLPSLKQLQNLAIKPTSTAQITVLTGLISKVGSLMLGEALFALLALRLPKMRKAITAFIISVRCLILSGALLIVGVEGVREHESIQMWDFDPAIVRHVLHASIAQGVILFVTAFCIAASRKKKAPIERNLPGPSFLSKLFLTMSALLGGGSGVALMIVPEKIIFPNIMPKIADQMDTMDFMRVVELARCMGPFLVLEGLLALFAMSITNKRILTGSLTAFAVRALASALVAYRNQMSGQFSEQNWADPIMSAVFFGGYFLSLLVESSRKTIVEKEKKTN